MGFFRGILEQESIFLQSEGLDSRMRGNDKKKPAPLAEAIHRSNSLLIIP